MFNMMEKIPDVSTTVTDKNEDGSWNGKVQVLNKGHALDFDVEVSNIEYLLKKYSKDNKNDLEMKVVAE